MQIIKSAIIDKQIKWLVKQIKSYRHIIKFVFGYDFRDSPTSQKNGDFLYTRSAYDSKF